MKYYTIQFNENLKIKDKQRMNEIKQRLGCKFYRYNETTNILNEY